LLIEEHAPTSVHISGTKNVVAYALSRIDADFNKVFNDKPTIYKQAKAYVSKSEIQKYEFQLSPRIIYNDQRSD
jgi:hypothetical protein